MKCKLGIFVSILILITLTSCTTVKDNKMPEVKTENIHSKLFDFDDNKITKAIEDGTKKDLSEDINKTYKLVPQSSEYNGRSKVNVVTPYLLIMQEASNVFKECNYDESFFKTGMDAHIAFERNMLKISGEVISFKITLYFNDEKELEPIKFSIEQNNEVLKTPKIIWLFDTKLNKDSSVFKYNRVGSVTYNMKKDNPLDLSKKAILRIIYEDSKESIYDIDFSKLK